MAIQEISLHKFTGGMSDDPRIQSDLMFQDMEGFDISDQNYVLTPLKDWTNQVTFDNEALIDSGTEDILYDGSSHYVLAENGSSKARVIKISDLDGTPSVTDPTGTITGTELSREEGSLVEFNNRAWFIGQGKICFFNLNLLAPGSTGDLDFGVHDLPKSYGGTKPVVGPTFELWIPNGKEITAVVPDTTDPIGNEPTYVDEKLILPDDIEAVGVYGRNGIIGTFEKNNGSRAWVWNGVDADTTDNFYIGPEKVVAFATSGQNLIALCRSTDTDETMIYMLRGNGFELIHTVPELIRQQGTNVIQRGNKVLFITDESVWVIGAKNTKYETAIFRLARLRLNGTKTGETWEDATMHSLFQDDYGVGVVGEYDTTESPQTEGIFYVDNDDSYFYDNSFVQTQKYRYRDIGKHHQLKFSNTSVEWGTASTSSIKVEYKQDDDAPFTEVATRTKADGDNHLSALRTSAGVQFNIGQETEFKLTSANGTKIKEHLFGLSPRKHTRNE